MVSQASLRQYAKDVDLHQKIRDHILSIANKEGPFEDNSVVILKAGSEVTINDVDTVNHYFPESFFFYVFGIEEPDYIGTFYPSTGKVKIYVPRLDFAYGIFLELPTPEKILSKYNYEAAYLDELESDLKSLRPSVIYLNKGTNTDSGATVPTSYYHADWMQEFQVDESKLFWTLSEARVFKLPEEVNILRTVAEETTIGHFKMMRACRPGMYEYELASVFSSHFTRLGGEYSYQPICGCGNNGSILHYPDKKDLIKDSQLIVLDLGYKGYWYSSDVTITIPSNGRFTEHQRIVYQAALSANQAVFRAMKPGVSWLDMHLLAESVILQHLIDAGVLTGSLQEVTEAGIGSVFFPHGLGHFLGLDTHDVGGYNKGLPRPSSGGASRLRTCRTLEANMYITNEPGCYFIDFAIDQALSNPAQAKYFNIPRLNEFRGIGGVRIEDDVLVTETGAEVLNKVPREIHEIESFMQQGSNLGIPPYIGAIDQGTSSTRFTLFDLSGKKIAYHQISLNQSYPASDRHEQDANEYVSSVLTCIEETMQKSGVRKQDVLSVGITNQRETVVAWDVRTGVPLHPAIVWDDTRTGEICKRLAGEGDNEEYVKTATGLPINPYFSGSKILWLIENVPAINEALQSGHVRFGTVETWLIYNLTREQAFITDKSNSSRTLLMGLDGKWDQRLLELFKVTPNTIAEIKSNAEVYGHIKQGALEGIPISGSIGDQQAALTGHQCFTEGRTKNTYGTGSFLLMNTGNSPAYSPNGLLTTIFAQFGPNAQVLYGLEGAVESAGSSVSWLINQLGLVSNVAELEKLASTVQDAGGVTFVPALSGLFTPYWNSDVRGSITGISFSTTKAHIARALLEGICFRTAEAVEALRSDSGRSFEQISVDGGMTKNESFLQMQADILGVRVVVPKETELTSLGAAICAGIGIGKFESVQKLGSLRYKISKEFIPRWNEEKRSLELSRWKKAVERSLS